MVYRIDDEDLDGAEGPLIAEEPPGIVVVPALTDEVVLGVLAGENPIGHELSRIVVESIHRLSICDGDQLVLPTVGLLCRNVFGTFEGDGEGSEGTLIELRDSLSKVPLTQPPERLRTALKLGDRSVFWGATERADLSYAKDMATDAYFAALLTAQRIPRAPFAKIALETVPVLSARIGDAIRIVADLMRPKSVADRNDASFYGALDPSKLD